MKKSAIFLAIILAPMAVSAATVSYTYNAPLTNTGWACNFTIPQFNPLAGLLQSVTITINGRISQTLQFENRGSAGSISFQNGSQTTGCLLKTGIGMTNLLSLDIINTPTYSFTAYDGVLDFAGTSGKTVAVQKSGSSSNVFTDALTLTQFTGAGLVGMFIDAAGRSCYSSDSGNILVGVSTDAAADVGVMYTYSNVPEPITLTLLGVGGMLLRRRMC